MLRGGHADAGTAREVGAMPACIHAFSAARPSLAAEFPTDAIFFDIRLEPYLLATADQPANCWNASQAPAAMANTGAAAQPGRIVNGVRR